MRGSTTALLAVTLVFGCSEPSVTGDPPAGGGKGDFIGEDDRTQIADSSDPRVGRWARSVALMVRENRLSRRTDGAYRATASSLQEVKNLCSDERFADEPVLGFCSAWLVAPDLVATAGHCVSDGICDGIGFVFDFHSTGASANLDRIPADRVFACQEIVAREFEDGGRDYALIRLDRDALGRLPFAVDGTAPAVGTPVATVGFPSGIYAKADLGGHVVRTQGTRVETTLDTFPGNSGAVVINLETGNAFAVHAAGARAAFVSDGACMRAGSCSVANVENGSCVGSIERLADAFANAASGPTTPAPPTSCFERCGDDRSDSCACDLECSMRGDCCADFAPICDTSSDAPACLDPGGPCSMDADCARMQCTCEGELLVTETFIAARGRCSAGSCVGDPFTACRTACLAQGLSPSTWTTTCFDD